MKPEKSDKQEIKKEEALPKSEKWIEKAEEVIDDTAEKIYQSKAYKKVGRAAEKTTKKLFRAAGRFWGKSEHYFQKGKTDEKDSDC